MKCEIIGYAHLCGVSKKSNKQYDFYTVAVAFAGEQGYIGKRVEQISVDSDSVRGIENAKMPIIAEIFKDFGTNRVRVVL